MQNMRVLITGASGFTGLHLQREFIARGAIVIPCSRDVDITDFKAVVSAVKSSNPTHIVHLAGVSFTNLNDADVYNRVNVHGTRNLLNAAADCAPDIQHITLASSAAIYGDPGSNPVSETQTPNPRSDYAHSKLEMEGLADQFFELAPILITRPFNYTGVGQPSRFIVPKIIDHFAKKSRDISLGSINVIREFSDVRDAASNYANLIASMASGPINLCTGRGHSIATILTTLSQLTGHKIDVKVNPDYIRPDDIPSLIGDPALMALKGGAKAKYNISETLLEMLKKASSR